jgi:hypothetical protein
MKKITINKFTPFRLEWNSYNGFILEIICIDGKLFKLEGERCLFGINWSPSFLYIDLFFKMIEVYDKNEYYESEYEE